MADADTRQLLYNWIAEANSPSGTFSDDVDRTAWVVDNFMRSWQAAVCERLDDAEGRAATVEVLLRENFRFSRTSEDQAEVLDAVEELIESLKRTRATLGISAGPRTT